MAIGMPTVVRDGDSHFMALIPSLRIKVSSNPALTGITTQCGTLSRTLILNPLMNIDWFSYSY